MPSLFGGWTGIDFARYDPSRVMANEDLCQEGAADKMTKFNFVHNQKSTAGE